MIGALWILAFTAVVGVILYIMELRWRKKHGAANASPAQADTSVSKATSDNSVSGGEQADGGQADGEQCCGLHLVCEKDSLSPMSTEILYYDDEELDRFIGREADSYTPEEEEEFREVLMTLRPEDVAGWARSITQRSLNLPADIRDELLLLVREQRLQK